MDRCGWLPNYSEPSNRTTLLANWTGTQDWNCYWANNLPPCGWWASPGYDWGTWTPKELSFIWDDWNLDIHSIEQDPDFRLNDADDYFVQNANVLAMGFENFIDDLYTG